MVCIEFFNLKKWKRQVVSRTLKLAYKAGAKSSSCWINVLWTTSSILCSIFSSTKFLFWILIQLHYNSKTLKTESPNASRGSSLPRTLSKESKLYGMKDNAASPSSPPLPCTVQSKTNTLLPPQPPPIPSGIWDCAVFYHIFLNF